MTKFIEMDSPDQKARKNRIGWALIISSFIGLTWYFSQPFSFLIATSLALATIAIAFVTARIDNFHELHVYTMMRKRNYVLRTGIHSFFCAIGFVIALN